MAKSCGYLHIQRKWLERDMKELKATGCRRYAPCREQLFRMLTYIRQYDDDAKVGMCNKAAADMLNAAVALGQATELYKKARR